MTLSNCQKQRKLGFLAGSLLNLFCKKPPKISLREFDCPTSTQRMGLCFSEKIRDLFRLKWIFIHKL